MQFTFFIQNLIPIHEDEEMCDRSFKTKFNFQIEFGEHVFKIILLYNM